MPLPVSSLGAIFHIFLKIVLFVRHVYALHRLLLYAGYRILFNEPRNATSISVQFEPYLAEEEIHRLILEKRDLKSNLNRCRAIVRTLCIPSL